MSQSSGNHSNPSRPSDIKRTLSLGDGVSIIVGTIIGAGIFENAPHVASLSGSTATLITVWVVGGLLALGGALCFAELAERFSGKVGGDYWFLRSTFGRPMAFLFAWASFWVIRPGNIGLMALTFGRYAGDLTPVNLDANLTRIVWAFAAIFGLSLINFFGLSTGKTIQNILTFAKVAGLTAVIGLGLFLSPQLPAESIQAVNFNAPATIEQILLALVLVMFAFGGWNDLALLSGELRNPERNLFRALVTGTTIVAAIYIFINICFVRQLGFTNMAASKAIGSEFIEQALSFWPWLSEWGGKVCNVLVCLACLGSINAMVITSPRIYAAVGQDYRELSWLNQWNADRHVPRVSIILQTIVAVVLLALAGLYEQPFQSLINATSAVFWTFLGLSFVSLIILRRREGDYQGFRSPAVPWMPGFLALVAGIMVVACVKDLIDQQNWSMASVVFGLMTIGLAVALLLPRNRIDR